MHVSKCTFSIVNHTQLWLYFRFYCSSFFFFVLHILCNFLESRKFSLHLTSTLLCLVVYFINFLLIKFIHAKGQCIYECMIFIMIIINILFSWMSIRDIMLYFLSDNWMDNSLEFVWDVNIHTHKFCGNEIVG